jgi:phosphatidylglycerophosphate synthase
MLKWYSWQNWLSHIRPLLIFVVAFFSAFLGPILTFWLFLTGWATDLIDGSVVKWSGKTNKYGIYIDKGADSIALLINISKLHFEGRLPEHFYITAYALLLWIPRFFLMKFYPKSKARRVVEIFQMVYFCYLFAGLTLFYSVRAYSWVPIKWHLIIIFTVAIFLVLIRRDRLTGIMR